MPPSRCSKINVLYRRRLHALSYGYCTLISNRQSGTPARRAAGLKAAPPPPVSHQARITFSQNSTCPFYQRSLPECQVQSAPSSQ